MSRRHGRWRESSAGRLAHPPHSMRVVEAWSAATESWAAFVRPHCRLHITEVHSAATDAAPTQSTGQLLPDSTIGRILPRCTVRPHAPHARCTPVCRIKWIRRHITLSSYHLRRKLQGPFSYAAGYAKLRSSAVSTRQGKAMLVGRFPRTRQENPGIRSPSPAMP